MFNKNLKVVVAGLLVAVLTVVPFIIKPTKVESATALKIVALGDSITGLGGFITKYKNYLIGDLKNYSTVTNLGVNNSTSSDLVQSITNNQTVRSSVASADLVTVEIGINDFFQARGRYLYGVCGGVDNQDCLRSTVTNFEINWNTIIGQVKGLTDSSTAIRALDIYYSVVVADQGTGSPENSTFVVLNSYLEQMNAHIHASAVANSIPVAQVHRAFNGLTGAEDPIAKGYILLDAVHPTDLGSRVIATELRVLGYAPLKQPCPDVNGDTRINSTDQLIVAQRFGATIGTSKYLESADVNGDGKINSGDMLIIAQQFNKKCL